jgi:hypothetical protein
MKYLFVYLSSLGALGAMLGILASWIFAFGSIKYNFWVFLGYFLGVPTMIVLGLVFYLLLFRVLFETILILFKTYHELQEINAKVKEMQ